MNRSVALKGAAGVLTGAVAMSVPLASTTQIPSALASPASMSGSVQSQHQMHDTAAMAGMDSMGDRPRIRIGPSGNKVEMVDPAKSTYIPKVLKASDRNRAKARRLLSGVNTFCRSHTLAGIKQRWRPGDNNPAHPTHYFNPRKGASGLKPARPRAALVYDGKIGGVMFTGQPLPYLGTIPRAHSHRHMAMGGHRGVEMVHVYCTRNLSVKSMREAFTPNRVLGVKADTIRLRLQIRPAIMDLTPHQLREVRAKVRGYLGTRQQSADRVETAQRSGPDPRLRRMRVEIRESLMELNEAQLRSVWRLMKSY